MEMELITRAENNPSRPTTAMQAVLLSKRTRSKSCCAIAMMQMKTSTAKKPSASLLRNVDYE